MQNFTIYKQSLSYQTLYIACILVVNLNCKWFIKHTADYLCWISKNGLLIENTK